MKTEPISFVGIVVRIVLAIALVLLTYNPSGKSFVHWVLSDLASFDAIKGFAGALLLVAWVIFARTAHTSLGNLGIFLSALVLGTLVWLLYDMGVLTSTDSSVMVWIILIAVGIILGIGLSWSLIRQRTTGQVEVD
jgi:hypothetical protein